MLSTAMNSFFNCNRTSTDWPLGLMSLLPTNLSSWVITDKTGVFWPGLGVNSPANRMATALSSSLSSPSGRATTSTTLLLAVISGKAWAKISSPRTLVNLAGR